MKKNFSEIRDSLPTPIFDEHPEFIELYWKAWELAWDHVKDIPGMPQTPYMDEGFCDTDIWIWDSCFMSLYCKYASELFPGYQTLENFYTVLHGDGELPEIIAENVPVDGPIKAGEKARIKIHIADNPPLFAWAEYENAKISGNLEHIKDLLLKKRYLQKHYDFLENITAGTRIDGVRTMVYWEKFDCGYRWEGGKSGMDNTPRGRQGESAHKNRPATRDLLWIDAICQQALAAKMISSLFRILNDKEQETVWLQKFSGKQALIREKYWDENAGFFFDIDSSTGKLCKVQSIGSYWAMTADAATAEQAQAMTAHLADPRKFGGEFPLVSLSRDDADFNGENGMYWRGSVWLPTAYAALKGCVNYGFFELARENTVKLLNHMSRTFKEYSPHTIWECYAPNSPEPSRSCDENNRIVRPDFCGWSALGPIAALIEFAIGIYDIDAFANTVKWHLPEKFSGKLGVKNLRFGKITADLLADKNRIMINSSGSFTLDINGRILNIVPGENCFELDPQF